MSIDATFMKGGNQLRLCDIKLTDGKTARVEPYAIFVSSKKRRHYLWFQIAGSDPDEDPGWKSPLASSIASVTVAEEPFKVRRDYDPFDKRQFPLVHYSVPTHDGRQRWHDARSDGSADKQTIRTKM